MAPDGGLHAVTADDLRRRIAAERIIPLSAEDWASVASEFEVLERHETNIAGELLVVRIGEERAAIEQPTEGERVVRHLGTDELARAFVAQRLEDYERMWDGCGCRIDYYE